MKGGVVGALIRAPEKKKKKKRCSLRCVCPHPPTRRPNASTTFTMVNDGVDRGRGRSGTGGQSTGRGARGKKAPSRDGALVQLCSPASGPFFLLGAAPLVRSSAHPATPPHTHITYLVHRAGGGFEARHRRRRGKSATAHQCCARDGSCGGRRQPAVHETWEGERGGTERGQAKRSPPRSVRWGLFFFFSQAKQHETAGVPPLFFCFWFLLPRPNNLST